MKKSGNKAVKKPKKPMKRSTKIALICICAIVIAFDVLIIALPSGSADSSATSSASLNSSSDESTKQTVSAASSKQTTSTTSSSSNTSDQVVYEDNSLKVTFLGVTEQAGYIYVNTKLENKTNNDMTVYPTDTSINGTMVQFGSGTPAKMTGGKSFVQAWIVMNAQAAGVSKASDIKTIEMKLQYPDAGENTTRAITINV